MLKLTKNIYFNISFTFSIPINIYSLETTVCLFTSFSLCSPVLSTWLKFTIAFRWVNCMISSMSMFSISLCNFYGASLHLAEVIWLSVPFCYLQKFKDREPTCLVCISLPPSLSSSYDDFVMRVTFEIAMEK